MKNTLIAVIVGLVIGVGGTAGVVAMTNDKNDSQADNTQLSTATDHSAMSMDDMNKELEGLSGDEYDKAFIEMMIAHHEGAVDMAELSSSRAKHDEIKQLSEAIISAQEEEISDMKQWQIDWNYGTDEINQDMHNNH